MAEPLETSDPVFVHLLLNCIENHSTNKWICTKFVDSKYVAKTRKHESEARVLIWHPEWASDTFAYRSPNKNPFLRFAYPRVKKRAARANFFLLIRRKSVLHVQFGFFANYIY